MRFNPCEMSSCEMSSCKMRFNSFEMSLHKMRFNPGKMSLRKMRYNWLRIWILTPTSKVSWKVEAFSLCMFLFLLTAERSPMERIICELVANSNETSVLRSQPQEQHEHSFCSSSTNAFISYSLYTVRRFCTSPGAPDLTRLGWIQGSTRNGM